MTAEKRGYTPRAEKVLENSRRESMNFKSVKTGTEHLLLAMLKEVDCVEQDFSTPWGSAFRNCRWRF